MGAAVVINNRPAAIVKVATNGLSADVHQATFGVSVRDNLKMLRRIIKLRSARSMMVVPMPFLVNGFAVTMRVDHQEEPNNQTANHQYDDDGFIPPDFADKFGRV